MRIAQIAPLHESVPPAAYGGTERVVSWLTEELVRKGHEVTLFASADSRTSARLVPICERALRLDVRCVDRLAWHVLQQQLVLENAHTFDVLHFHTDYLHFPLARRLRLPQVTTLHGRLDLPDLAPLFAEFADLDLVSISTAQRSALPQAGWIGTVHHGLPQDLLQAGDGRGGYLAFLGRISPEKGADRAIEIARRAGMPLRLAAKVDTSDEAYYASTVHPLLARADVEFVGEIGEAQKAPFLGGAAALLMPIDWPEPFGLVMIEALACGTPVVAFDRGSVREIVDDGSTGFVCDGIDAAVAAVGRLHEIDRQTCRRAFETRFTAERMADDYVAIYEQRMQRTRHGHRHDPRGGPVLHRRRLAQGG